MVDRLWEPAVLTCPSCKGLRMEATISQSTGRLRKLWRYQYRARTGPKTAFNHAISADRLPDDHPDPLARVKAPPQNRRNRALSGKELDLFLEWLPSAKKMSRTVKDVPMLEPRTQRKLSNSGRLIMLPLEHSRPCLTVVNMHRAEVH